MPLDAVTATGTDGFEMGIKTNNPFSAKGFELCRVESSIALNGQGGSAHEMRATALKTGLCRFPGASVWPLCEKRCRWGGGGALALAL